MTNLKTRLTSIEVDSKDILLEDMAFILNNSNINKWSPNVVPHIPLLGKHMGDNWDWNSPLRSAKFH